jgi:hypothetical protein
MELITTIQKVKFDGKWVEFWYEENENDNGVADRDYDISSKAGYLWEAIEKAGIYDEVISNGLKGKKLKWEKIGYNYEIKEFV